jgi:nitrate/nitrite transporter NarK
VYKRQSQEYQAQFHLPENNTKSIVPGTIDINWKKMIRTGDFWVLFAMLAFSASAGLMIIGHITGIAKTQAGWNGGFILVMMIAVFNALGRFLGGAVSDKIGRANLMRIVFILQAINMALFGSFINVWSLALGVAVAGLCYGATFSVFPAATADLFGIKNFGANYGLMFIAWGFGGVLGPLLAGSIFDHTGSYQNAYWLALALLLIASAMTFALKRAERRKRGLN